MKITLALFVTLLAYVAYGQEAISTTVPFDLEEVKKDLSEIIKLIPRDNITQIANDHLAHDEGFKAAIRYMQTPEWRSLVDSIRANPKWIAFKESVSRFGLDIDQLIKCTKDFIEKANVGDVDPNAKRSLASFIKDVEEVIPAGQMMVTLGRNKNIQGLLEEMSSEDSKAIVMDALKVPEVRKYMEELSQMDLNVHEMLSFLFSALGWGKLEMS